MPGWVPFPSLHPAHKEFGDENITSPWKTFLQKLGFRNLEGWEIPGDFGCQCEAFRFYYMGRWELRDF